MDTQIRFATRQFVTRVLVVPHVHPRSTLRIRSLEIAQVLAKDPALMVYVLDWPAPPVSGSFGDKVISYCRHAGRTVCQSVQLQTRHNCTYVSLSHLVAPHTLAAPYNRWSLRRFIQDKRIDCIINANGYHFTIPKSVLGSALYIYDLVDDHLSLNNSRTGDIVRRVTLAELRKADHVVTISHSLVDLLRDYGYPDALYVPNGVDYRVYQAAAVCDRETARRRYGLDGKYVISYIGNHSATYCNLEFITKVFSSFLSTHPDSSLLIVGPVPEIVARGLRGSRGIILTGPVSTTEVISCYHASDVGVLPFALTPFTEHALPLKILEYGAARKQVIASPLAELKRTAFPHVNLVPLSVPDWVQALQRCICAARQWDSSWDAHMRRFDWEAAITPLREIIAGIPVKDEEN